MKRIILLILVGLILTSATLPQFFYYNSTRKAIAISDSQAGTVIVKNYTGIPVLTVQYTANRNLWISVTKLAPGLYSATTQDGASITFYKRP